MAYVSQDRKASIAPRIKTLLKEYGLKGSLSVRNASSLVLTISEGELDFIGNTNAVHHANPYREAYHQDAKDNIQVNVHHIDKNYSGKCCEFLTKARAILNDGNHDNSDIQTDYFDVGWYVDINVGKWDKPYRLTK